MLLVGSDRKYLVCFSQNIAIHLGMSPVVWPRRSEMMAPYASAECFCPNMEEIEYSILEGTNQTLSPFAFFASFLATGGSPKC